jgi:hypothetical protein
VNSRKEADLINARDRMENFFATHFDGCHRVAAQIGDKCSVSVAAEHNVAGFPLGVFRPERVRLETCV